MEYTTLGLTDMKVSRLGFGCWAISGHGYGRTDDKESIRAIRSALDLGVNFFDTADIYGFGYSEELLAKALGPDRNKVVIASKFGVCWDDSGRVYKDCSLKRLAIALEASLRRLQMDCIPLYQIHYHDGATNMEEVMEALVKLKQAGKIRHIGCTNFSLDLIEQVQNISRLETVQLLYNLVQREREATLAKAFENFRMGTIAYSVLARGLLSGNYGLSSAFDSRYDTRSKDAIFSPENLQKTRGLLEELKKMAARYGKEPAQIAIRWVLDNPAVSMVIVGVKKREQIEKNFTSLGWRLDIQDKRKLDSLALGAIPISA